MKLSQHGTNPLKCFELKPKPPLPRVFQHETFSSQPETSSGRAELPGCSRAFFRAWGSAWLKPFLWLLCRTSSRARMPLNSQLLVKFLYLSTRVRIFYDLQYSSFNFGSDSGALILITFITRCRCGPSSRSCPTLSRRYKPCTPRPPGFSRSQHFSTSTGAITMR